MKTPKILSVHIPRTGGTTLKAMFDGAFGVDNVYHHKITDINTNHGDVILDNVDDFKVIHGHFPLETYQHLLDKKYWYPITILRNPVKRFISNYFFWKQIAETTNDHFNPIINQMRHEKWTIEQFTEFMSHNIYFEFIKGRIDRMFVLIQEVFETDIKRFEWVFNCELPRVSPLNVGKNKISVDPDTIVKIKRLNRVDIITYRDAVMNCLHWWKFNSKKTFNKIEPILMKDVEL